MLLEEELGQIDKLSNPSNDKVLRKYQIQNKVDEHYNTLTKGALIRSKLTM